MPTETVNIVQLLYDLSESSDEVFYAPQIEPERDSGLQYLVGLGAIEPGPRPESVTCSACDADHSAAIEFDVERRCYFHFCPEVGLVTLNDVDIKTYRFRPEWLVDWLAKELPVTSLLRRPPLVDGRVWQLGETACGDTLVTVIFARRVLSQADRKNLVSALRPVHPPGKGLVITTSPHVAGQIQLPHGFEFFDLGDIIRSVADQLIVDRTNLEARVQGSESECLPAKQSARISRRDRKAPRRLDYREADKPFIAEMHAMILGGQARNATDAARALASRAPGNGKEASKVTRLTAGYIKLYAGD